ncbi:hypothetical protein [Escherichia coli]|uniref:hypothetical protein n=1 Tax=Escherichia coli TaxID=562 RepID=UPI0034657F43
MPTFSQIWDYERITPASAAGETLKSIQGAIGEYFRVGSLTAAACHGLQLPL